jgi:adenylylsulfate kinase
MILQIIGLPGSGKTTLARELCRRTDAIHLNADEVRSELSSDLGFSPEDRIEQARRLGSVSRLLSKQNKLIIVDFVNPTQETRKAFGAADFVVWVNRIASSRFEDTNNLWEAPRSNLVISTGQSVQEEAELVLKSAGILDWTKPTTLQLGRYQPWHEGHEALKFEALKRTDQVLLGVRNTQGVSEKDPFSFEEVQTMIFNKSGVNDSNSLVLKLPNITNIVYGRDVGYKIEHVDLPAEIKAISATQRRKQMGIG